MIKSYVFLKINTCAGFSTKSVIR